MTPLACPLALANYRSRCEAVALELKARVKRYYPARIVGNIAL